MSRERRRPAVNDLKSRRISGRACRLVQLSRSATWYRLQVRDDGSVRERLRQLAQDSRYGCPTLDGMLATEGRVVNFKRTYRMYREEGPAGSA
jgi:putative transposase